MNLIERSSSLIALLYETDKEKKKEDAKKENQMTHRLPDRRCRPSCT